jgi:hypothetical protein
MPIFTIETNYHLPVFRHRTLAADTLDAACRAAVDDDNWDAAERDVGSPGKIHVSGIWDGADAFNAGPPVPIPPQFADPVQRRARHFEILLGLLKILFDDVRGARSPSPDWLARAAFAIARGEAILAGVADPDQPIDPPRPSFVLLRLQVDRVRDAVSAVLDIDPSFEGLSPEAVVDDEIQTACLSTAATMDFSDVVGRAEFEAALLAIRSVHRRLARN